ncbi:alpha/beta fold hydrolase [Trujillonella endophytica]|uniref:alpha/beta fold hydrolase n=1 Tax=Trujillonella endophytica TaxID=673521 RepID=UPI001B8DA0FE|nr:alpha/beta fold hydrolase [Trujillella endophytica]
MAHDPGGRAVLPDVDGVVERDGVALAYEVYGSDHRTTVLLLPTWSIIPSRHWRAQIGHLARHHRVVTFDGRGSGRSGRPVGAAAYTDAEYAADAIAVLDATGTGAAVLVGLSCGATWAVHVAARSPERALGVFAIGPACALGVPDPERERYVWDTRLDTREGWAAYNRYAWTEGGYDDFLAFFFARMFPEPHSTKQIEDGIAWARDVAPETLVDTTAARLGCDGTEVQPLEPLCRLLRCPVTVVHGVQDRIRTWRVGERLAELTGGSLVLLEGSGHGPHARDPVRVNLLLDEFVARVAPPPPRRTTWTRAAHRGPRALYLSSPIGLGHARRDVAIAAELRDRHPGLAIDWLAQHPVTSVLADAGERVHPASAQLANESGHVEAEAGEHDLHAFSAIRRMDEILVSNFMVFADLVREEHYDLVVADEAWDVDHFLHDNPELKRFRFAWLTDFVGWLPMPEGGAREAALTADLNAEMLEQRERHRWVRDRSVFVGNPADVVDAEFGPGLPRIRDWTAAEFDFAGYVTGFDPARLGGTEELRAELGAAPGQPLCLVTVGGSGVGGSLLRRVLDAVPLARRLLPELRVAVVTGPRIDPRSLPELPGVRTVGYLPELHRYLAACDVAVVQGGLTTCMELTALNKPFVYVPLRRHFEQNLHVRRRLEQYGAGRCLPYEEAADPDALAAALVGELGRDVRYRPVETDGAARAAALLAELL